MSTLATTIPAGIPLPITVAVSPLRPGHAVILEYRVDGGLVHQVISMPQPRVGDGNEPWQVRFGAWGLDVKAPAGFSPELARATVAEAVFPYVDGGAWDDAALASLHAVARIVRTQDRRFLPFLPTTFSQVAWLL